jgi:cytoskeleton protein RodZ
MPIPACLGPSIDTLFTDAYIFCCCGFLRMSSTPFGEQLKREREMRGVSLEEISVATRIAPRFLEALENEQWEQLPGGVFNRGFIRSVARYLGLDEDSLVAEYALQTKGRPDPGVVAEPPDEPDRLWARVSVLVVLAILIIAAGWAAIHYLGPKIAARLHKHSGDPAYSAPARASSAAPVTVAGPNSTTPQPAATDTSLISSAPIPANSPANGASH